MDGFDAEAVIFASGLESTSVASFLHENFLDFIDDSEIDDIAACLAQLSDADVLGAGRLPGSRRFHRSDALATDDVPGNSTLTEICAANVAARGVCFWNTHPAPRQFRPMRAPELYTVQRGIHANSTQLHLAAGLGRVLNGGSGGLESASVVATELLPTVRSISQSLQARGYPMSSLEGLTGQQPPKWTRYWRGKLTECVLHAGVRQSSVGQGESGEAGLEEEDPIENW